jgi:hypothetical protein
LRAGGTRDRGADQAHPDQRKAVEYGDVSLHGTVQSCGVVRALALSPFCRMRGIGGDTDGPADCITASFP